MARGSIPCHNSPVPDASTLQWASLAITALGFTGTIWQIVRAAKASEETRDAVQRTEHRMALNHLLVLLPQLRVLESDLDAAAEDNDRHMTRRALATYSHVASEVAGILEQQDEVDPTIPGQLKESARKASQAKAELISDGRLAPKSATRPFREELSEIISQIGALVGRFRLDSGKARS